MKPTISTGISLTGQWLWERWRVMATCSGRMDPTTQASSQTTQRMERGHSSIPTATSSLVIGRRKEKMARAGISTSKEASMKVASKAVCRMDLANILDSHPSRVSTKEGRGRQENTGTSRLPATQVILRPPWEHMGGRGNMFGLAERFTLVDSKQGCLMDVQLWRSLVIGDMWASLLRGKCTVRERLHGRTEPATRDNSTMGR